MRRTYLLYHKLCKKSICIHLKDGGEPKLTAKIGFAF